MSDVIRKLRNKVQMSELSGAVIVVRIQGESQKFVIGEDMKFPSLDKMLKMFNCYVDRQPTALYQMHYILIQPG